MSRDAQFRADSLKPPLARIVRGDVPDGGAIRLDLAFQSGRESVIVTRRGDAVGAFINRCPHARWPLDTFDGRFLFTPDGALICAAHSAVFDPISGACLGGPGQGQALTAVEVIHDGDAVILGAKPCPDSGL
jgi:nitrite reductase/ring-hydroxylating ferredoxin subunit